MDKHMTDSPSTPLSREERLRDIGKRLHEARQGKNISIQEVAGRLNFSVGQAKALESGDWSTLPDQIYGLGFARQYASYLGVDISDDIRDLKASVSLNHPVTIPDPAIAPSRRWAWMALLLFIALGVYYNMQGIEGDILPSLTKQTEPAITTKVIIPEPSPTPASTPPAMEQATIASPEEPAVVNPKQDQTINTEETPATVPSNPTPAETQPEPQLAQQDTPPTTPQAATVDHELNFAASGGDVWLRINATASDGTAAAKLKETLLRDGQSTILNTEEKQVVVTAGNALNLTISVDGKVMHNKGTLGRDGKVVRNLALHLDGTKQPQ